MLYMVTFAINIPPMLAYIPYMDPMGIYGVYTSIRSKTVYNNQPAGVLNTAQRMFL